MGAAARPAPPGGLPDRLDATHRRFLRTETILGMIFGGMLPALAIWLFRSRVPVPLFGSGSVASSLLMATLAPAFGMPIGLTFVVRYRVRAGSAPGLAWPLRAPGLVRFVPQAVLLRGALAAGAAVLVLPPAGLLLMLAAGVTRLTANGFVLYNFIHGMALGALVLPLILTRALTDGAAMPSLGRQRMP